MPLIDIRVDHLLFAEALGLHPGAEELLQRLSGLMEEIFTSLRLEIFAQTKIPGT
jgi:hypothetical protein